MARGVSSLLLQGCLWFQLNSVLEMGRLYQTGDYGRLVKGTVLYEGRTDSQVKVRGHRVDLAEVDAALNTLQQVDKTSVLCYHAGEVDQVSPFNTPFS